MMTRSTISAVILILALLVSAGCMQPEKATDQVMVSTVVQEPSVPAVILSPGLSSPPETTTLPITFPVITTPASPATSPVPTVIQPVSGGYVRYAGADYSIEYPAAWSTNVTRLPLNEYHHTMHGCSVAPAYNLDREFHRYYATDGSALFYSSVVKTERDIWPRNLRGEVVYEDIINSVLGNPDSCANSPEGAFTIAGISQVPLDGVSYTGVQADFGKINATGFTDGTGSAWIVTGKEHRGVFVFYRASKDSESPALLADYMFGSLRMDPGF
jgi:hypothetical protein